MKLQQSTILALTLHPEWAWAICHAGMRVVRCTSATTKRLVEQVGVGGWIAIHAGVRYPANLAAVCAMANAAGLDAVRSHPDLLGLGDVWHFGDVWIQDNQLPRGVLIILAQLGEILPCGVEAPWKDVDSVAIALTRVFALQQPIRYKGRPGIWTPSPDVQQRLRFALQLELGEAKR